MVVVPTIVNHVLNFGVLCEIYRYADIDSKVTLHSIYPECDFPNKRRLKPTLKECIHTDKNLIKPRGAGGYNFYLKTNKLKCYFHYFGDMIVIEHFHNTRPSNFELVVRKPISQQVSWKRVGYCTYSAGDVISS